MDMSWRACIISDKYRQEEYVVRTVGWGFGLTARQIEHYLETGVMGGRPRTVWTCRV